MITSSEPQRRGRILRNTLLVSLVLHVLIMAAAIDIWGAGLLRAIRHQATPPDREVVTISSAVTIGKRPKPAPVRDLAPRHGIRKTTAPAAPKAVLRAPAAPQPRALRAPKELAKATTRPLPQPPREERQPQVAYAPQSSEQRPSAQRPLAAQTQPRAGRPHLTQAQLAQIESDLSKTIARARSAENPLNAVPKDTPAAPRRYGLQMQGQFGQLRAGEGYWTPISHWQADGWDWYYVSYEFVHADGTLEHGYVPWPIRFPTRNDPVARGVQGIELPWPLPDFRLTPEQFQHLGKALRQFFPGVRFPDDNGSN